MWECVKCGCKAIARDLGFCPQCFKPKEDSMPKATTGGASNANAEPGEAGYIEPGGAETAQADLSAAPDATAMASVPEKAAEPPAAPKAAAPPPKAEPAAATGPAPEKTSFAPVLDPDALKGA